MKTTKIKISWDIKSPKSEKTRVGMMYCFKNCSKNNN
jgi:hypothetical protein